eukprot:7649316-Pyramimonas_sp.AAC.1
MCCLALGARCKIPRPPSFWRLRSCHDGRGWIYLARNSPSRPRPLWRRRRLASGPGRASIGSAARAGEASVAGRDQRLATVLRRPASARAS